MMANVVDDANRSDFNLHASANPLFDSLLKDARNRITQLGLNEILLNPTEAEFSKKAVGILWKGSLILTNGKFSGLETLHRVGEARISFSQSEILNFQKLELTFNVDLGLTNPKITYDFQLNCDNRLCKDRDISGVATGTISSLTFNVILSVNVFTRKVRVRLFRFLEIGRINTEITGLGMIFDFLASKATSTAANRMKQEMANDVEREIEAILTDVFETIPWPVISDLPAILMQHTGPLFNI